MQKILIATHNAGKLREFSSMFTQTPYELVSLSDVGIDVDVDETGVTYAENATLKTEAYARLSGLPTLADDSGTGGRRTRRGAGCALGAVRR